MRAIGVLMGLEDGQDRLLLRGRDRVHRMPARRAVLQRPGAPAFAPAPRAALGRAPGSAHAGGDPSRRRPPRRSAQATRAWWPPATRTRDPATQSQRPFPSASIKRRPSPSAPPRTWRSPPWPRPAPGPGRARPHPGLGCRQRVQRALTRDHAQLHDRRAIHAGALGRGRDRVLAADQAQPDLVLLARRQEPLAAPTPRAGTDCDCGSLISARSWIRPTGSQMRTDYNREVWREVRRKPSGGER